MTSSSKRNLTRRRFLPSSALGVRALLFADHAIHSLADGLTKLDASVVVPQGPGSHDVQLLRHRRQECERNYFIKRR
jgi:hypothetical protein